MVFCFSELNVYIILISICPTILLANYLIIIGQDFGMALRLHSWAPLSRPLWVKWSRELWGVGKMVIITFYIIYTYKSNLSYSKKMIRESTTSSIIERHIAHLLTWLSLSLQSLNGSPIITTHAHTHKACEDPLKLRREHGMTYLSKSRHVFKFWTFGCFNSTYKFINTLVIYWCFMGDMWILSDCFTVMLPKYDGKIKSLFFGCWFHINKCWMVIVE